MLNLNLFVCIRWDLSGKVPDQRQCFPCWAAVDRKGCTGNFGRWETLSFFHWLQIPWLQSKYERQFLRLHLDWRGNWKWCWWRLVRFWRWDCRSSLWVFCCPTHGSCIGKQSWRWFFQKFFDCWCCFRVVPAVRSWCRRTIWRNCLGFWNIMGVRSECCRKMFWEWCTAVWRFDRWNWRGSVRLGFTVLGNSCWWSIRLFFVLIRRLSTQRPGRFPWKNKLRRRCRYQCHLKVANRCLATGTRPKLSYEPCFYTDWLLGHCEKFRSTG